jgi:hypothetical protein
MPAPQTCATNPTTIPKKICFSIFDFHLTTRVGGRIDWCRTIDHKKNHRACTSRAEERPPRLLKPNSGHSTTLDRASRSLRELFINTAGTSVQSSSTPRSAPAESFGGMNKKTPAARPGSPPPPPMVQKRVVSFGNPALGTYHGDVYTSMTQLRLEKEPNNGGAVHNHSRLVAMVNVPPAQVPEGILHVMGPFSAWIVHVRIVIDDTTDTSKESSSLKLASIATQGDHAPCGPSIEMLASAEERLPSPSSSKSGALLETATTTTAASHDRSYVVLIEFVDVETATSFVQDVHNAPYTSLDDSIICSVCHVVALEGINGVSVMSPLFAANTVGNNNDATPSPTATSHHQQRVEDYNCAVCLEHMDLVPTLSNDNDGKNVDADNDDKDKKDTRRQRSSSSGAISPAILTTVCNHSFHMSCLEQWQDSPCPVCRYDHSGLNETLSRCHECGTTDNNYVCLICGVVSCADPTGSASSSSLAAASSMATPCSRTTAVEPSATAGLTSCNSAVAPAVHSHARRHYDQTLHAYALHTESQHVWDFAGQGYVHRLLQNKDDGKVRAACC